MKLVLTVVVFVLILPPFLSAEQQNSEFNKAKESHVDAESLDGDKGNCGDANNDGNTNIMDVIYLFDHVFGGSAPSPYSSGNVDASCRINMADVNYLNNFLYGGGPSPVCADTVECSYSPSAGNGITIGCGPYTPYAGDDSVAIPVYIDNNTTLRGVSLGFHYPSTNIEITSVDVSSSVAQSGMGWNYYFDAVNNMVSAGWSASLFPFPSELSPQTDGLLLILNARILSGPVDQAIELDSIFVGPGADFMFVSSSGASILPEFVPCLQANIEVTNTLPTGDGSLYWAITEANNNAGADSIVFTVSGTIALTSALPTITDDTTIIVGSTAPGGINSVIVDGSEISGADAPTFVINASYCVIEGLVIKKCPEDAIAVIGVTSEGNKITKNLIYENVGLAINLGTDGVTVNDLDDSDEGPNHLLNYPVIDSAVYNPLDSGYSVYFDYSASGTVEFFAAHPANDPLRPEDPSGHGEAYAYLGSMDVSAKAKQIFTSPKSAPIFTAVTATMTNAQGTSEMSVNHVLFPAPLIIVAYSPVNLQVIDPVGDSIGKDQYGTLTQSITDATYDEAPNDSITITFPLEGTYTIIVITEDGAPPGSTYGIGIRIDGSTQCILVENAIAPAAEIADTLGYEVMEGYHYKNGDANDDFGLNLLDILCIIDCLYGEDDEDQCCPEPTGAGDANCDLTLNLIDILYLIDHLYGVPPGQPPCPLGE